METRDDMSGLELLRRLADDLDDSRAWWLVKESRQRFWGCDDFSEVSLRDLLMELYGKLRGETGGAEGSRLMPGGMEWPRFEGGEPVSGKDGLVDECCDVIQAVCNLLAAMGVDDLTREMEKCRSRNEARGRFDEGRCE